MGQSGWIQWTHMTIKIFLLYFCCSTALWMIKQSNYYVEYDYSDIPSLFLLFNLSLNDQEVKLLCGIWLLKYSFFIFVVQPLSGWSSNQIIMASLRYNLSVLLHTLWLIKYFTCIKTFCQQQKSYSDSTKPCSIHTKWNHHI